MEDRADTSERIYVVPLIVAIAFLMESIDQTIITASIPAMARSFAVTPLSLNLAITAYLLSLAVFIPISGWIADRFGARRVFLSAILVFCLGSILCGASTSLGQLVGARMIQGIGGALMTPVGRLILLRSTRREDLVVAIAYMTTPVLVGPLVGPILGGVITTYLDWRWIFFINLPISAIGIVLTLRHIHSFEPTSARSFDFRGFLLCAAALVAFQVLIENVVHGFLSPAAWVGVAALCLIPAVIYALRWRAHDWPVLDLSLFATPGFRIGVLAGGLCRIGMNAVPFLVQLQLQIGFGYSPIHSGLIVFVTAFGALLLKPFLKRIVARFGYRRVLAGNALIVSLFTAGLTFLTPAWPLIVLMAYLLLYGWARSLQFNVINALIYARLPGGKESVAVSVAGVAQQLFMGLGISLSAAAATIVSRGAHAPSAADFARIFPMAAGMLLIGGAGFLLLAREPRPAAPAIPLPDPDE